VLRAGWKPWGLVAAGLALQVAGIFEPLSPWPLIEWATNHENLEVRRGHRVLLETGTWEEGDPGFDAFRRQYMGEMLLGLRSVLEHDQMPGLTIRRILLAPSDDPGMAPRRRDVFVVFSNGQAHRTDGGAFESTVDSARDASGNFIRLGLVLAGIFTLSKGLLRLKGEGAPEEESALANAAPS